jgi:flavin reductase (DIM6/NTAB) family NADH-FMN oxidoreductase RutF
MKTYKTITPDKAYKLLNTGAIILVSTKGRNDVKNLTPIAWNTLVDYEPVTRLLFVCDKEHKTYTNIIEDMRFVVILPHVSQTSLIKQLGSVSGKITDKIQQFEVNIFKSDLYEFDIPEGSIAYLECKVYRILDEGGVSIIFGEVENAKVDDEAFTDRLLSEKDAGKTLHHLGSKQFVQPGNDIF